ncbi:hypothetical protein [Candidatus Liberibacter brunswickensis]|uniref:hypothetical protein n=1 Tax=Candidatus Liberibacter brunswickensis TaxID=1968796 RepID=UPI002FE04C6E
MIYCLRGNNHYKLSKLSNRSASFDISNFKSGAIPISAKYSYSYVMNELGTSFDWLSNGIKIDRKYEDLQRKKYLMLR